MMMKNIRLTRHDFSLYEAVKRNGQVFRDRLAVVDNDRRLTFGGFLDRVDRLAVNLRKEGTFF